MTVKTIYLCDECGVASVTGNHWFVAEKSSGGIRVEKWSNPDVHDITHLCGEQCLQKFIAKWAKP